MKVYVCVHECLSECVCAYVCVCVYVRVCLYAGMCMSMQASGPMCKCWGEVLTCRLVGMCVCVCACMYVCI